MRHSLRDAELPPPAEGWARLQRELGEQTPAPETPARPRWRILWPQVAAAAAAVLVCVVAGGLLLRQGRDLVREGDVIASAADTQTTAAPMPQQSDDTKSLSKTLAEAVGLSQEPSDAPSSSMRPQGLVLAHYGINLGSTLVASVIALVAGELVFGLAAPEQVGVVVLSFALGLAAMFAVGYTSTESDWDLDADEKKAESDRWGVGVGYNYPLSKRTNVYAVAGYYQDKITNEDNVDGEDRDPSTTTVMLGMRHRF